MNDHGSEGFLTHPPPPAVTLSQTYVNDARSNIEAIYKFPLPESAAVNAFHVEFLDGRKVVGKVEEKKKALRMYQDALMVMSIGHCAVFLVKCLIDHGYSFFCA